MICIPFDQVMLVHYSENILRSAGKKNILCIRIIHGKGTGALREGVHKLLDQLSEEVDSYTLGNETTGGWGATVANLKKLGEK